MKRSMTETRAVSRCNRLKDGRAGDRGVPRTWKAESGPICGPSSGGLIGVEVAPIAATGASPCCAARAADKGGRQDQSPRLRDAALEIAQNAEASRPELVWARGYLGRK